VSVPLVVGVGHPDRGDDAVGLLVAEAVGAARPDLDVRLLTDPLALVDLLSGCDLAVVVDAATTGSRTGTVHVFDATDSPLPGQRSSATASSHGLSPGDAIELARAMGQLPARLVVVAIEVDAVELGQAPQPLVLAAAGEATARVLALVSAEPTGD
jgi:hydrogenase maturation protease